MDQEAAAAVDALYRTDWGRIVATLIRLVGDFEVAEDAAQEAFAAAVEQWPKSGVPDFPRAWVIQTARNKAIDRIRRRAKFEEKLETYTLSASQPAEEPDYHDRGSEISDDRLRLIFTCCHPALSIEAQVSLTLRTLCGLETDQIARAFLVPEPTMAQRIVRAKRKIRTTGISYAVPEKDALSERLDAVLTVIYLIFNEGYASTRGARLMKADICREAIRLCRLLQTLMAPDPPGELIGLLALMLLHDSRRNARLDDAGDLVVLEKQDRGQWDRQQIAEALPLVDQALRAGPGPFAVEAAIAGLHCQAERAADTDWPQIVRLYEVLERLKPSPIVSLNRAVAVAMVDGPSAALAIADKLIAAGELDHYHLVHATRADFLRRMGSLAEAAASYEQALALVQNESERRFLERRLRELRSADGALSAP